jgi:hypothetical protein
MHMCVDQTRRDIPAGRIDDLRGVAPARPFVHAGDQRTDNSDIGRAQLTGYHIHQCSTGDEDVERRIAACGGNGAGAERIIAEIGRFACGEVRVHRAASRRSASRITVLAPSASSVSAKCALNVCAFSARGSTTVLPRVSVA